MDLRKLFFLLALVAALTSGYLATKETIIHNNANGEAWEKGISINAPGNATIVGDVTMKEIMPKLEQTFGDWQKGDVPTAAIPPAPAQGARGRHLGHPGPVAHDATAGPPLPDLVW